MGTGVSTVHWQPMISLQNITWEGHTGTILADQTINIAPGECIAFVGGPKTGKTTLIELLTGERKPTGGSIFVDGIPLEKLPPRLLQIYRRSLGILLQKEQLLDNRSIAENIVLPLRVRGFKKNEIAECVRELLQKISLTEKEEMFPSELPQNERRLVALAQAVAGNPKILLLDEPFRENSDAAMMLSMLRTAISEGATVIMTTRNLQELTDLPSSVIHLGKADFRREANKTPWKKSEGTRIMPVPL